MSTRTETGCMTMAEIGDPSRATGGDILTDAELLARWSAGTDPGAIEQFVRRHGGMVLGVCRRILGDTPEVDDAFQATFLVFVRKARSLARPEQAAGWLHGVALRVSRKARVARARRHLREVAIVDPVAPDPPEDTEDLRRALDEELDRLPDKYRLPIILCELEGRTLEEAARLLGWPKGTVAGRLSRGRDLLRRRLSRRRGLVLPLFLIGAADPPDLLVSATVATATGRAEPAAGSAALAAAILRDRYHRLIILFLAAGLFALLAWQVRAVAAAVNSPPSPDAPASGRCHPQP
jgi:RNA polymerase sigma factor (sigma-70 family)